MSEAADDTIDDPLDPAAAAARVAQDRAREGLDHLQNAARELIAAARAALDVAEDFIDDPDTISSVVGAAGQLGGLGDLVRTLLPAHRLRRDPHGDADPREGGGGDGPDLDGTGSGVERIEVV